MLNFVGIKLLINSLVQRVYQDIEINKRDRGIEIERLRYIL